VTGPPGERRARPDAHRPGSREDIALDDDAPSVRATRDFLAHLADCTGPDDPTFRAVSLLADAWGPALNRSYRLGFDNGYAAGFWEAEHDMARAWARAVKPVRA
jgi:hypothetical protein